MVSKVLETEAWGGDLGPFPPLFCHSDPPKQMDLHPGKVLHALDLATEELSPSRRLQGFFTL